MLVEVKVPQLAESVADATLMSWHRQVGDYVEQGENLIDLETDKVTLEVTAPQAGVIKEFKKREGESAVQDEVLAVIDTEAEAPAGDAEPAADQRETGAVAQAATEAEGSAAAGEDEEAGPLPPMSPTVRKLVAEKHLDPRAIDATGKDGRLTKADVQAHLEGQGAGEPAKAPPAAEARGEAPRVPAPRVSGERPEERVPMTRLRKRAAERLLAAQQNNAVLTTFNEVDMKPVMDLRARYKADFEAEHGVRLGLMSFFVKACVEGLKKFPVINASVDGEDIVYHGYYDIGIAVSAPRGLVVPILRDADVLSFAEIESAIRDFGKRAESSQLTIEELTGGTFTITNGGVFGSLVSTPIINPPQSAILGMHKTQDRPVAVDGEVVVRPMMYLAVSYDHRIIDGREAVQFLVTVKEQLEDPARMLLAL